MQGKNGIDIRNQQEKSYQNDELFVLGFEKVLKNAGQCYKASNLLGRKGKVTGYGEERSVLSS